MLARSQTFQKWKPATVWSGRSWDPLRHVHDADMSWVRNRGDRRQPQPEARSALPASKEPGSAQEHAPGEQRGAAGLWHRGEVHDEDGTAAAVLA